ncbi:cytochrome P460 family protein [Piscinibacter sp. Jin2]|uniref:Cytochrome P460 family protein n=1 Tax=Aquariibacter lacus TaxID=2801332 RepID=A0A9X1BNL0_9BURK|nr:cytochrome P460 family protein [Piscinibacter lacus]MBL0720062.1 cytochrome P460 family protein [Piscinibacter lacus]
MKRVRPLLLALAALVAACSTVELPPARVADGELPLPEGYTGWSKFLSAVQRPDARQVREIYMNRVATEGTAPAGFPNGSVFVMENYAAQTNPDGTLKTGPDGKLLKGELQRVFVMGKQAGWGEGVPEAMRTGNWVYASYLANGQKSSDNLATCRACHVALKDKPVDFVFRYDEYFKTKRSQVLDPALRLALGQPTSLAADIPPAVLAALHGGR